MHTGVQGCCCSAIVVALITLQQQNKKEPKVIWFALAYKLPCGSKKLTCMHLRKYINQLCLCFTNVCVDGEVV